VVEEAGEPTEIHRPWGSKAGILLKVALTTINQIKNIFKLLISVKRKLVGSLM
jgi:hypothetical protein